MSTTRSEEHVVTLEQVPSSGQEVGGTISITHDVVAQIAEIAARGVQGVHDLGRWRLVPFSLRRPRGVAAEVGQAEAALDLEVVLEFGTDIRKMAAAVRTAVAEAIDTMADRQVVEVNLKIVGIQLPLATGPAT